MIGAVAKIFKKCDLFGQKPKIRVNNSHSYQTIFGGANSIAIIIVSIAMIKYFSINVIKRTKSNIVYSVLNTLTPPPLYLDSKNFSFAISMEDDHYNYYIDPSIYTISGFTKYATLVNGSWDVEIVPLNFTPCQLSNFPDSYHSLLNPNTLKDMYCFDKNTQFLFDGTFPLGK